MKPKILAVTIMTVALLALSFIILQDSIANMKEETMMYGAFQGKNQFENQEVNMITNLPAYKGRTGSSYSSPANAYQGDLLTQLSGFNASLSSEDWHLTNSSFVKDSRISSVRNTTNSRNSYGRSMAVSPIMASKPQGFGSLMAVNTRSLNSTLNSENKSDGSSSNKSSMIGKPMRMDGDGENPPPEGMPIGEGVWILLALVVFYGLYRRFVRVRELVVE